MNESEKILIFGATRSAIDMACELLDKGNIIVAWVDNDSSKWGGICLTG